MADDDEDARALVSATVRRAGFEVLEAADGRELLEHMRALQASAGRVDVVVSDIGMPNCDGIEATRRLLAKEPSLPVVLVTAFSDDATLEGARLAGAQAILRKPFTPATLTDLLLRIIRQGHARESP